MSSSFAYGQAFIKPSASIGVPGTFGNPMQGTHGTARSLEAKATGLAVLHVVHPLLTPRGRLGWVAAG